jgi:hypothetical protein
MTMTFIAQRQSQPQTSMPGAMRLLYLVNILHLVDVIEFCGGLARLVTRKMRIMLCSRRIWRSRNCLQYFRMREEIKRAKREKTGFPLTVSWRKYRNIGILIILVSSFGNARLLGRHHIQISVPQGSTIRES